MAGDWIGIDHELPEKPEVLGIHEQTGVAIDAIIGRLFLLWRLFDRQTENGFLPKAGPRSLSVKCGGSPDFWEAVAAVGWIIFRDDGAEVPAFSRRFGKSSRRRMLDAIRKRAARRAEWESANGGESAQEADGHADAMRTPCGRGADAKRTRPALSESESESKPQSESEQEPKPPPESDSPPVQGVSAKADTCRVGNPTVAAVFGHYQTYHPKARPGTKERKLALARFKEGYSPEDLCQAIDGIHLIPHNLGANDSGTKYLSLELILRDSSHVSRYMEAAKEPPRPRNQQEQRVLDSMHEWLERMEK